MTMLAALQLSDQAEACSSNQAEAYYSNKLNATSSTLRQQHWSNAYKIEPLSTPRHVLMHTQRIDLYLHLRHNNDHVAVQVTPCPRSLSDQGSIG
jgi:hypothetical protein